MSPAALGIIASGRRASSTVTVDDMVYTDGTQKTYTPPAGTTSILIECFGMANSFYPAGEGGGYAKGTLAYTGQALQYQIPVAPGGGDMNGFSNIVKADSTNLIWGSNGWDDGYNGGAGGGWVDTARLTGTTTTANAFTSLTPHIKFTAS